MQHRFYSKEQCAQLRKVNMPAKKNSIQNQPEQPRMEKVASVYMDHIISVLPTCHVQTHGSGQLLPLYNRGVEKTTY